MIEHFCYFLHNLIPACDFNVIASALPVLFLFSYVSFENENLYIPDFFFFALSTMSGYTIKGNHQQNKNSPH